MNFVYANEDHSTIINEKNLHLFINKKHILTNIAAKDMKK